MKRLVAAAALSCAAMVGVSNRATAQPPRRPLRALVLYTGLPEHPMLAPFTQQFRVAMRRDAETQVEFYEEYLDLARFPGTDRIAQLARYLAEKYQGFSVDVVVTTGTPALNFATTHFPALFPGVPVIFSLAFDVTIDVASLPQNVTGRTRAVSFVRTVELARGLQPDANRVVVISGAARVDSSSLASALADWNQVPRPLELTVIQAPPLDRLDQMVMLLPKRTIVFVANFELDGAGQTTTTADVVTRIAAVSGAPVYGHIAKWVGRGIVGGAITDTDREGALAAQLALRVLRRAPGEPMPPVEATTSTFAVDERELHRWRLDEGRLPSGTAVLFREPTLWQRHSTPILVTLALLAAQSVLIGRLLVERRRRRAAQLANESQLAYVARVARVATVGELAATLAHEVRQPLAAIRLNTHAGVQLLSRTNTPVDQLREVLDDISHDDVRAADVIDRIQSLLRRDSPRLDDVDLNDVCRGVRRLLQADTEVRNASIELALEPALPLIGGDFVQLQQVVLNLALNGLEAASCSPGNRQVVISTRANGAFCEVSVRDTGPGVAADIRGRLFEPFVSTKATGLGMGLSIVRSIVHRHGGRITVVDHAMGGADFRVALPVEPPPRDARPPDSVSLPWLRDRPDRPT
jgi:signal transduction histidine kinase